MSDNSQSRRYEDNYAVLEKITESLNKDEIGIDDLVEKTREALDAARTCMEILNKQKGEFKKLETEFSQLLRTSSPADSADSAESTESTESTELRQEENHAAANAAGIGEDDPF